MSAGPARPPRPHRAGPALVTLAEAHRYDADLLGTKAAALARLAAAGLPVPPGVVVTIAAGPDGWDADLLAAIDAMTGRDGMAGSHGTGDVHGTESIDGTDGTGRFDGELFAVRSSARDEDLAGASYAGLYDSYLDVDRAGLVEAVRRCLRSADGVEVAAYQRARQPIGTGAGTTAPPSAGAPATSGTAGTGPGGMGEMGDAAGPSGAGGAGGMAVLVQRMVRARAAGVAFTAHPLTGARDETVVNAVRGLGERLVSGAAVGDEWVVGNGTARCLRDTEHALDEADALRVAALAARVAALAEQPQDVEWALADGAEPVLLQARPMTALPEPATWVPPGPGSWMRNFRLGEWLPEPVTPLFGDWLLPRIEYGFLAAMRQRAGAAVRFPQGQVNGWYYTAHPRPPAVLAALARGRLRLLRYLWTVLFQAGRRPEHADRVLLGGLALHWRATFLPGYRAAVRAAEERVETASRAELVALVDEVGALAGTQMFWISAVGGAAWKMEGALAAYLRDRLGGRCADAVQWLLCGLPCGEARLAPYAVSSLDWFRPTLGELPAAPGGPDPDRRRRLVERRMRAEADCRSALADRPADLARFETLLAVARKYAVLRDEQGPLLTLGWPVLRRAVLGLGELARAAGVVDDPADAFFLTTAELAGSRPAQERVRHRRERWERQRRLSPPLTLGPPEKLAEKFLDATVEAVRTRSVVPDGAIVGHPASPGRATGPARLVRGPEDFARFAAGEVLVGQATAPAWTPLFARAAAVVTDGGTLAAHASLIAREYGIPAVVGAGDATARIRDGQLVTVDGGAGTVELDG
ncbi:PEP/pyruvate-binding domain-containing protein [Plantactinospora endophytica]|uniref:Pyruvate, water dikinase n=1 Tax=Plantactinospora endophytica TaxID=673535 RepID=A0ABQ4EBH1_9ACTN|nr:PEP/pyruvate-binding domain-containing protein [Plantactinospora endophytica]GIG92082.1 hypothetical protein Pen02_70180 [Plantactinospora endophytica]